MLADHGARGDFRLNNIRDNLAEMDKRARILGL